MLRGLLLILASLNLAYLAWSQGWLMAYDLGPPMQREPARWLQQVRPEVVTLLDEAQVLALQQAQAQQAAASCMQSGWLQEPQALRLRAVLGSSLPQGSWSFEGRDPARRWLVYMGRYENPTDLDKKREQLARMDLHHEPVLGDALAPGLSLGSFASRGEAEAALNTFNARGVRSARVVQDPVARAVYQLRLPAVDDDFKQRLQPLKEHLPVLTPCPIEPR